jgi:hypothetical protein
VAIPSKVDVTSVLGGSSDLTTGSITTISSLAPDTYTAYTFGALVVPLPVTLTRFAAVAEGRSALLSWATTEETNSERFDIERSLNGKQWNAIGSVASTGESKVLVNYTYTDASPRSGTNLYRLKMIDKDGTFAYSVIRDVKIEGPSVIIYPNPVSDKLLISNQEQVSKAILSSSSGALVHTQNRISGDGIDIRRLSPGIYTLTLTLFDGTISTHKVAVTR